MNQARHILFDLDGTLSDPKEGITKSLAYAMTECGYVPPPLDELTVFIGPPLRQIFATLLKTNDTDLIERAAAAHRHRYVTQKRGMIENILYPDIKAMLETLTQSGKKLYVATSKSVDAAIQIIEHFGLSSSFVKVYGAAPDGKHSDKGDLIAHLLTSERIAPQDAMMIGDRNYDLIGAAKNNVASIGVLWGYGSRDELTAAGATALAETPKDLQRLLTA